MTPGYCETISAMAIDHPTRACTVVLHDDRVSTDDVLCGVNILQVGGIAFLTSPGAKKLCICPSASTRSADEVSVHVTLAQRFGFENRTKATLQVIEDVDTATASHVELFFRDQHLSRADMWRLVRRLNRTVMYKGQALNYLGFDTARVEAVYHHGKEVESSYVTCARTKPIFRSGSARFTILVQVSKAMLEYWTAGDLMYERLLFGFLPELFRRWEALKVRHQVSLVLFGRSICGEEPDDFFEVIASDIPSTQWHDLLRKLTKAFNSTKLPRQVSLAAKGNMLEAINMAAIDFSTEDVDCSLSTTGSSIIAITADTGMFETTHELLHAVTAQLMGNSIGVDIVALSPKPLHPVPLFSYERDGRLEFALPHWVDVSYWEDVRSEFGTRWLLPDSPGGMNSIALPELSCDENTKNYPSLEILMERYDNSIFENGLEVTSTAVKSVTFDGRQQIGSMDTLRGPDPLSDTPTTAQDPSHPTKFETTSPIGNGPIQRPKIERLPPHSLPHSSRKISLGPKGLAPSRSLATTTVSSEQAQLGKDPIPSTGFTPNEVSSGLARQIRQSLARKRSEQSLASRSSTERSHASKPIDIRSFVDPEEEGNDLANEIERTVTNKAEESTVAKATGLSETPKARQYAFFGAVSVAVEADAQGVISPWVTLLNPCNPKRENMRVATQYRKWQHVFPRTISSGSFKWASMCSPAALPLTTEYRPSVRELEKYSKKHRRILVPPPTSPNSIPAATIVQHLVALRLSHGFQMSLAELKHHADDGTRKILMSLGSLHHELECLSPAEIQIIEYTSILTPDRPDTAEKAPDIKYRPSIWASAARRPRIADIKFVAKQHSELDWSVLDDHVVSHDPSSDNEGMSKMRFVLIPVDPPRTGHGGYSSSRELSDEERRIDGINKLTQLWQRHRHFTEEDQRHHASIARSKPVNPAVDRDPNPLAIAYETRDPSAMVNAYGPMLTGQLSDVEGFAPLFQESEMYHTSTFDVVKLIKHMQEDPPHGVEVRDRRWFTRLHLKCFRGDEMVNWLLRVFKDMYTREDAVAVGNKIMNRGMFAHVRHRHDFRDGNYFYQITSAHRTTEYPDTASMFGKSMRSMPSTPMSDSLRSPLLRPFHVSDSDSSGRDSTPTMAALDKKQILLSQAMQYNVDTAKRSNQLEVINLHYDRIHNPENCYHIQLDWTDATAKLIRDAVSRWTTLVEFHCLKLVQIPLAEACKLHVHHPFDEVVPVTLAVRPPDQVPATPQLNPQSFAPQLMEDPLAYQKALLRKMDFVLDYEAAASFTTKLEVSYSWGRPEYELTQFVHRSGLLLAQVAANEHGDFLLLPNRLVARRALVSTVAKTSEGPTADDVMQKFIGFCRDAGAVKAFYEEVSRVPRTGASMSPFTPLPLTADRDGDVPPMSLPPHMIHRSVLKNL